MACIKKQNRDGPWEGYLIARDDRYRDRASRHCLIAQFTVSGQITTKKRCTYGLNSRVKHMQKIQGIISAGTTTLVLCISLLMLACSCSHIKANEDSLHIDSRATWSDLLLRHLTTAEGNVDVAVNEFTNRKLAECLIQLQRRDVQVRLYIDKTQMIQRVKIRTELGESGAAIRFSSEKGALVENFCIIDGKKVIKGFPDWIPELTMRSVNNAKISKETEVISKYTDIFENMWNCHFSLIYPYRF